MRQLGIIQLGRILIIEAKEEQIRTNTFFVQQLQNVRQNVVCGRGFPVVGKPFTTVLVTASFLEWSDTGVDENLADRVLCFLKLQLLHVGLLVEKDPLQQGWFWRNPWGKLKRTMGSLVKQRFTYDPFLLLLPLFQIRCQLPLSARTLHYFDESTQNSVQRLQPLHHVGREEPEYLLA
jgi:hypothetical protein